MCGRSARGHGCAQVGPREWVRVSGSREWVPRVGPREGTTIPTRVTDRGGAMEIQPSSLPAFQSSSLPVFQPPNLRLMVMDVSSKSPQDFAAAFGERLHAIVDSKYTFSGGSDIIKWKEFNSEWPARDTTWQGLRIYLESFYYHASHILRDERSTDDEKDASRERRWEIVNSPPALEAFLRGVKNPSIRAKLQASFTRRNQPGDLFEDLFGDKDSNAEDGSVSHDPSHRLSQKALDVMLSDLFPLLLDLSLKSYENVGRQIQELRQKPDELPTRFFQRAIDLCKRSVGGAVYELKPESFEGEVLFKYLDHDFQAFINKTQRIPATSQVGKKLDRLYAADARTGFRAIEDLDEIFRLHLKETSSAQWPLGSLKVSDLEVPATVGPNGPHLIVHVEWYTVPPRYLVQLHPHEPHEQLIEECEITAGFATDAEAPGAFYRWRREYLEDHSLTNLPNLRDSVPDPDEDPERYRRYRDHQILLEDEHEDALGPHYMYDESGNPVLTHECRRRVRGLRALRGEALSDDDAISEDIALSGDSDGDGMEDPPVHPEVINQPSTAEELPSQEDEIPSSPSELEAEPVSDGGTNSPPSDPAEAGESVPSLEAGSGQEGSQELASDRNDPEFEHGPSRCTRRQMAERDTTGTD